MTAGGKAAHVGADFGKNHSRGQRLETGSGSYLFDGGAKGRKAGLHLQIELGNGCIEGIYVTEMQA